MLWHACPANSFVAHDHYRHPIFSRRISSRELRDFGRRRPMDSAHFVSLHPAARPAGGLPVGSPPRCSFRHGRGGAPARPRRRRGEAAMSIVPKVEARLVRGQEARRHALRHRPGVLPREMPPCLCRSRGAEPEELRLLRSFRDPDAPTVQRRCGVLLRQLPIVWRSRVCPRRAQYGGYPRLRSAVQQRLPRQAAVHISLGQISLRHATTKTPPHDREPGPPRVATTRSAPESGSTGGRARGSPARGGRRSARPAPGRCGQQGRPVPARRTSAPGHRGPAR